MIKLQRNKIKQWFKAKDYLFFSNQWPKNTILSKPITGLEAVDDNSSMMNQIFCEL